MFHDAYDLDPNYVLDLNGNQSATVLDILPSTFLIRKTARDPHVIVVDIKQNEGNKKNY